MENVKKSGGFFAKGWLMVAVAFVVTICTQGFGIYSFSMLRVPLTEMLGCDSTQVALGFSMYTLVIGFASLVVGDVIEKLGLRISLIAAAVLYGGGFFLLGTLQTLPMVYVAYFVMGVGAALGGTIVITGIPSNWFVKRRGLAIGIVWCAMLPGSLITTQFVSSATAAGHWQTSAIALGVISMVVLVVASFVLKWRPQEIGLLPDGMTAEEAAKVAEQAGAAKLVGLTRKQAFKTSSFWLLFVAFALVGIGEQGPFQNFPSYMVQSGYGLEVAGNFMTFLAFAGCIGKLTAGLINDRIGPKWSYCLLNVLCALSLLAIMVAGSQSLVLLFACGFFFGAALSSSTICFSAATAMYLGPKHFGQIYGMVFLGKPIMDAVGVPLITAIAQGAGGWGAAFMVAAVFVILSVCGMFLAKKNPQVTVMEEQAARELAQEAAQAK